MKQSTKKTMKKIKKFEDGINQLKGRFAVYPREYGDMIPITDCILFDEESKAQWHCIINPSYTYVEIKG